MFYKPAIAGTLESGDAQVTVEPGEGGICGPMVELLKKGRVSKVIDVQDFDLDAVLAALEIDTGFNVNVLTGPDGVPRGAPGGHTDTTAGSKVCIIVTLLVRGRIAAVCEHVVTVTTPRGLRGHAGH